MLQKPFLKWVGGKTQMINKLVDKFPSSMKNYHETFLGGGSVLLALLTLQKEKKIIVENKIYAYDLNRCLIELYIDVRDNKDEIFDYISKYKQEYSDSEDKEAYYYIIRTKFNKEETSIEKSAMFLFLNKTCFRGMYREGPNGFNVPYGHYKKTPTIITKEEIDKINELIRDVEFICSDFESSITKIEEGDFVYFDPPYAPETKTSFVGYTKDGFGIEKHNKLFTEIVKLDTRNVKFLLSNAKVTLVTQYFKDYNCEDIVARRAINSKNPGSNTIEVIINN